jgi:hypothetical protein
VTQAWTIGGAQIVFSDTPHPPTLRLTGSLSAPDALDALTDVVVHVDAVVAHWHWPRVVVDIAGLEYASVALWKAIAHWLGALKRGGEPPYRIDVRIDESRSWQAIGRSMLVAFGSNALIGCELSIKDGGSRAA